MPESAQAVLVVLESVFPTSGGGGAESQVRTLALEFIQRGVPISVIVPMVGQGSQKAVDSVDCIPVVRIRYPKLPGVGAIWLLISLAWLLYSMRDRYSVLYAHIAGNMAAVSCIVGRLLNKPVVVKVTGLTEMKGGVLDPSPSIASRIRRVALRRASAYQATSNRISRLLVERGFSPSRVLHIPNAVDVGRFMNCKAEPFLRHRLCGDRRLVGVYVGRLEAEKGLEYLVRGWAKIFGNRNDAVLLIVGEGKSRDMLRALCQELGILSQLKFVGASPYVERYLAIADFGVLTSLHEGLSNTLLEYMAAGLPVLGSEVSGTEDFVISGRTGWLFPPADVDAFANSLGEAADCGIDELRRRGREARLLVVERASIHSVVDQLQSAFGSLMDLRA